MSAVEELAIVLEHDMDDQYQYETGEVIRGQVRIKVTQPTAIRTVTLRVVGEGNVSWKEEDTGRTHQAEEKYVDVSKVVMDTPQSSPHNLQPGCTDFPFQYQLPDNLPSSFIGKFGNVTYTMKATATGVKSIDTSICSEPFMVQRRSLLPVTTAQPLQLWQEKRFWGCCSFGKVSARLTLEGRGGVPGQDMFLHAVVKNQSWRTVTALQASLIMVSMFQAQNNSIGFSQVVSKKRDETQVQRGEGRRWNYVRLTLPPYIPETDLDHCDMIDIEYIFQFRVEISDGAELKMESPVLIGSDFHGQESWRNRSASPAINHQWTVLTQGLHDGDTGPARMGDTPNPWGLGAGVPELHNDGRVVKNPLFQHGVGVGPPSRDMKDVPEEHMENTRL